MQRPVEEVIQVTLDQKIREKSDMAENFARPYIPVITRDIVDALEKEGYEIVSTLHTKGRRVT